MFKPSGTHHRKPIRRFGHLAAALLVLPLASLHAGTPESVAFEFDDFFRALAAEQEITGAAFAIATRDAVVLTGAHGYTDTSQSRPIDENTAFRIASVSKTFAAVLAGVLVEEGAFRWDDRVVDHVPEFRLKDDASRLRVRDLVGQSTGLVPHAYDNLIEDGLPLADIERRYGELTYICPPGECYSYQNSVFSLIEPIIESTAARPYERLMEDRIFRPLDMRTASIGHAALVGNPNHARPHVKRGGRWAPVPVKPNYYLLAPAAGINASALDMGKWLTAQLGGQPAVLDPEVVEMLTEPRVETPRDKHRKYWRDLLSEAHYGLGWRIYRLGEHQIAYHSGWVSGYRADLAYSRELGIGIAVLMNVEGSSISELTTTFWRMALAELPSVDKRPHPVVAGVMALPD